MEKTYVITVPGSPKSVNEKGGGYGAHFQVAGKEKKAWEETYLKELMVARVPKGAEFVAVDITIRFKFKSGGPGRDVENFRHPVVKPLADALVKGGYIAEDTEEWFQVRDFRLEEAPAEWPHRDPRVKSEMIIKLEGQYL